MRNSVILLSLLFSNIYCWAQGSNTKTVLSPITIQWMDSIEGYFSFSDTWSYPEGIYRNEFGQLSCDGFCTPESDAMKDKKGRIYKDSLGAFYKLNDTTHQYNSIECEAWCYEWAGTDFIEVQHTGIDSFYCHTRTNVGTHCSLHFQIVKDSCYAFVDLHSVMRSRGASVFLCTNGYLRIDKDLWKKGMMKAEFSMNFDNTSEPDKPMFWKGKIYARIKNN